jgi:hypothetical protein
VHTYLLAEAGVPIIEIVNLEELAAEDCMNSPFSALVFASVGATGAAMRPVVMPLKG